MVKRLLLAAAGCATAAILAIPASAYYQPINPVRTATAVAAPSPAVGGATAAIQAAFGPLGPAAVAWANRVARCESGLNPNAVSPSGAVGLFQFMPSTWASTPQGRAGMSRTDPNASAAAAAWMYSQGRQGEWSCK